MTSPPKNVSVECPDCKIWFDSWYRPSMNFSLEQFDDDYVEQASTATCPACGCKAYLGVLIVNEAGTFGVHTKTARFFESDNPTCCVVLLEDVALDKKFEVISCLRKRTKATLPEVKALVDCLPAVVTAEMSLREAKDICYELDRLGAKTSIQNTMMT